MVMILKLFFFAFISINFAFAILAQAQDQSGFISLDCGLPKDSNYTDSITGLDYISDDPFIDTGKSKGISPEFRTTDLQQQLWNVRSFPEGIRNCYNVKLPRGKNNKYLIRGRFMYGNYDARNATPQFDLHLQANFWFSMKLENATSFLSQEIIHVSSSDYLQVCLVNTGLGTPFISALEIRTLNNTIYETRSGSLQLFARLDVGSTTNKIVRYEDDFYDRIWVPYNFEKCKQLRTSLTIDADAFIDFRPPKVVMSSAATPANDSQPLEFSFETDDPNLQFYVYVYFSELQKLQANESRQFNISFDGRTYEPLSPEYLYSDGLHTVIPVSRGNPQFSFYKTGNSTLPPILNAIEIYYVKQLLQPQTNKQDVDAIRNIKSIYGVKKNWEGDPCAPQAYLWDGVNCSYDSFDPPTILSLNLSSSGLTGEIAPYFANLTLLQDLDLSNNSLTGVVPNFLAQLQSLRVLNLEGNMLKGSVPVVLIERSKNGSLSLSIGGNPELCPSVSCKKKRKNFLIPAVASVAILFILLPLLAVIWSFKRRKQQAGKVDTGDSFELKNSRFTYSDILKFTNNFENVLAEGGSGTVYLGHFDKIPVAIKMLFPSSVKGNKQFEAEVKLLLRVHHRNLATLIGYCEEGANKALIYEYMANGSLAEQLADDCSNILTWKERLQIAVEAAQGLEYLHHGCKPPIIHRDVKSANILLDDEFQAKLSDIGLSRTFPSEGGTHVSTSVAGTPGYLDPEYIISDRLTEKSDVYSFGVVLLEIITGQPVIKEINENEKTHISQWVSSMLEKGDIRNIVDARLQGDFDINSVQKTVETAMACVSRTSAGRPTMNKVFMGLNESLEIEVAPINQKHQP